LKVGEINSFLPVFQDRNVVVISWKFAPSRKLLSIMYFEDKSKPTPNAEYSALSLLINFILAPSDKFSYC